MVFLVVFVVVVGSGSWYRLWEKVRRDDFVCGSIWFRFSGFRRVCVWWKHSVFVSEGLRLVEAFSRFGGSMFGPKEELFSWGVPRKSYLAAKELFLGTTQLLLSDQLEHDFGPAKRDE